MKQADIKVGEVYLYRKIMPNTRAYPGGYWRRGPVREYKVKVVEAPAHQKVRVEILALVRWSDGPHGRLQWLERGGANFMTVSTQAVHSWAEVEEAIKASEQRELDRAREIQRVINERRVAKKRAVELRRALKRQLGLSKNAPIQLSFPEMLDANGNKHVQIRFTFDQKTVEQIVEANR